MRKYLNQQDMKRANAEDVFLLIRENPGITRKQIERMTELSWGGVSNITGRLLEEQYIIEYRQESSSGAGRVPSCLAVNDRRHYIIGLDINISGFSAVVMNLKNDIVGQTARKACFQDAASLREQIFAFVTDILRDNADKHILGMGIAMQGIIDAKRGLSLELPQCPDWRNVPLAAQLSERFHLPVFLEHDPDCILYAESRQEDLSTAILLRVDGGIGMSVMLDGVIQSRLGMYEIGHLIVRRGGEKCSCGKQGCLEAYASMRGMERRFGGEFAELAAQAENKNPKAVNLFREMAAYLGETVSNTACMLNISDLLLCGAMWDYRHLFYADFLKALRETAQRNIPRCILIRQESAAYGAALIAVERALTTV